MQTEPDCEEPEDSLSLRMPHFTQYRGGFANRDAAQREALCKDTFSVDVEVVLHGEQDLEIGPLTPRDLDEDGYVVDVPGEDETTNGRLALSTLNTSDLL